MFRKGRHTPGTQGWQKPHLQRELGLAHVSLLTLVVLGDPPAELTVGLLQLHRRAGCRQPGSGPAPGSPRPALPLPISCLLTSL